MIARVVGIATLFVLCLVMLSACPALPWDEYNDPLRAVLAEFPQYDNVSVSPEFNPKFDGCVLVYITTDSREQVLAYFKEQFEAHDWSGASHFSVFGNEIIAHRDKIEYRVQFSEGPNGMINGQPLPPDAKMVQVSLMDRSVP